MNPLRYFKCLLSWGRQKHLNGVSDTFQMKQLHSETYTTNGIYHFQRLSWELRKIVGISPLTANLFLWPTDGISISCLLKIKMEIKYL